MIMIEKKPNTLFFWTCDLMHRSKIEHLKNVARVKFDFDI